MVPVLADSFGVAGSNPATGNVVVIAARMAGDEPHRSDQYDVRTPVLAAGDAYAYWRELSRLWRHPVTLVNVEHDMEFSDDLVRDLVECPHPLCTHAYRVWINNIREWIYCPTRDQRWITHGVEWAHTSSLGFCKIAPEARTRSLKRLPWKFLEHGVCDAVTGCSAAVVGDAPLAAPQWHVHWPEIEHFHPYDAEVLQRASEWERFCAANGEPCLLVPSQQKGIPARNIALADATSRKGAPT